MLPLDPLPAATKALQLVRKNQDIPLEDGEVGDLEREALAEGLPEWVASKAGYLYLAGNISWPQLYKLGCTRRTVEQRMAGLSNAGMATPWVALASWWVPDAHGFEALAHQACAPWRVRGELFHADPDHLRNTVEAVLAEECTRWQRHLGPVVGLEALENLLQPPAPLTLH